MKEQRRLSVENIRDIYPLSPLQEGMFFNWSLDPAAITYFEQQSVREYDALNIDALKRSLGVLVNRHDILRTVFIQKTTDRPIQVVLKESPVDFQFQDIEHCPDKETLILEFKAEDKRKHFNLSKDILFRVAVFRLGPEEYELIWSWHHILMDAWCINTLKQEFYHIYNRILEGAAPALPAPVPYSNYIRWLGQQDNARSATYWTTVLADYTQMAPLPFRKQGQVTTGEYVVEELELVFDETITARMNGMLADLRITHSTFFQALWGILLAKCNDVRDAVFGVVVSGRPTAVDGIEHMIGTFINTIPVRVQFDSNTRFVELLKSLQGQSLDGVPHHHYALAEIQAKAGSGMPLFDHIFLFQNFVTATKGTAPDQAPATTLHQAPATTPDQAAGTAPDQAPATTPDQAPGRAPREAPATTPDQAVATTPHQAPTGSQRNSRTEVFESYFYDFNIFLIPGEKVKVLLKFNGHKYQSAGLQDLLRYFKWLTETVVQDMNTGIDQLSLLSGTEQDALISRFNRDICSGLGEKSFVQLLEEMSIKVPDHIAVRFGEISLTYAMLSQQSDNLAAYLRKKGVKKGDRVGILADRSEKLIVALIATLKLNACFVPIDPTMPAERRRYILKDAGIHFLFTMSSCLLDLADTYNGGLMALDIQLDGLAEEDFLSTKPEPDDLAYLIYTSGSTGKPKGVMIRHRGFLNYLLWANDYYFNNEAAYSFAFFTSLAFDLTITCIFTTLLRGDTIHIYEEKDVAVVLTEIFSSESGVNTVKLTPSHISLLESLESTDTSIRTVIVGGEALTKKQVHLLKMLHPAIRIYNEYGPTETTVGCTVKAITEEAADITIGKPINNTAIYILNNSKQVQPVGILGEIAIGGLGLAAGYLENDGLTSEKFIENPYKKGEQLYLTGDVGKWLPDGDIFYTGRKDNQVKIRGYRIEPGEVEMVGLRYSGILECLCMPDEQCNALIFYYRSDTPLDAQQLQRYFGHHLPAYMVPAIMIPVQAFLLTANGKIDRRKLPDPQQQRYGHIVLPENEMERGLLKIWQEVLEQTEISVEDKFFSIGGHSLKATQVASRILREIRIKVSLKDIFDYDTIRELARIISQQTVVNEAEISPAPTSDYYPLSHSQQRIWVSSRLQEEQLFYTPASSFIFDASFNLTGFENGVKKLIARHEVLRTTFDVRNGEAVQFIHPYEERMYTAEVINVRRDTVKQVMDEEACQPFDLGNGPLFRVKILHVDNDQYLVLFSCHHIISDGWSLEVLMKEFNHYYQSFSRHITPDAPPLRIQYKDYAHWHNALLRSGTAPMKTYWLGKLAGRLPVLQLPADYVRPAKKSGGAGIYRFTINKDLTHKLSSLTVEKGATIFMSLLACIKILIFHLTGEKDIIVGTPVAGRVHKELEEQLGNYLNILALRDELHERLTFADLLQHIRTTVIEAYDYQLYPFDLLLEELHYPRQQDRNPVFDIGFTLQNQVAPEEDRGQDHSEPADDAGKNFRGADTDLWWVATQMKDQISMSLHYDRQLFKTATMTSFAEGLQIIIDKATARINSTIAEITPFQTKVPDRKLNINLKI